jgi:hypothetical protein
MTDRNIDVAALSHPEFNSGPEFPSGLSRKSLHSNPDIRKGRWGLKAKK